MLVHFIEPWPMECVLTLECLISLACFVLVWMQLQRQLPVRPLDIIITGILLNAQDVIVALLCQDVSYLQNHSSGVLN